MNFLDLPEKLADQKTAGATVLPLGYDATTSWKQGTGKGPEALIAASHHIELYDEELRTDVAEKVGGIHTFPPFHPDEDPAMAREQVRDHALKCIDPDKLLICLGGEHSITFPLVEAHAQTWQDICVLQIDAHADLRDEYNGSPFNHACPMKRIQDMAIHVTAVGIRSVDQDESAFMEGPLRATFLDYQTAGRFHEHIGAIVDSLPSEHVYITIDLDGLNPAEMPAVGTPIPGGLSWHELLSLLRAVAAKKTVVGADVVELMPIPGHHASDSLAARLVYKLIGYNRSGMLNKE